MRSQGGQCKAWRICWPSKVSISTAVTSHKMTKIEKTHGLMVGLYVSRWVGLNCTPLLYNGPHYQDHTHLIQPHINNLLPSSQPMDDGELFFFKSGFAVNYPQVLSLQSLCCFPFVLKPISWNKGKRLDPLCTGHMTNSRGCNSRCDQDNRPQATRTRLGHWQVI